MDRQVIRPFSSTNGFTRCAVNDQGLRFIYGGVVFFYRDLLDPTRLAHSLAQILGDFATYAGRLRSKGGELYIQHGGDVIFEVLRTDGKLQPLIDAAKSGRFERVRPRVARHRAISGNEALLLVRLTITADGCALAILENHCAGDMHGLMLLMRAWAAAYRGEPYEKPLSPLDRDAYLTEHLPDSPAVQPSVALVGPGQLARIMFGLLQRSQRVHLDFSSEHIDSMRASVPAHKSVTSNDAVCARLFWTIRKLQGATAPANLCLTVNYRKRAGLPDNLIGNCITMVGHSAGEHDSPIDIALGLRAELDRVATHHVDYHALKRALAAHPRLFERVRLFPRHFQPGRGDLLLSSLAASVYELRFKTAGPIQFASLTSLPAWFGLVYEQPNNAGMSVDVALPTRLAQRLNSPEGRALLFGDTAVPILETLEFSDSV